MTGCGLEVGWVPLEGEWTSSPFLDELVRHLIRLMLSWVLIAITSIVIVLTLVFWVLDLDDPYEATEHALLLLLPSPHTNSVR
jgi:hypothetical protein